MKNIGDGKVLPMETGDGCAEHSGSASARRFPAFGADRFDLMSASEYANDHAANDGNA